jgi:hypothetical protein
MKGNRRRDAVQAFQEGLKNDPENRDILWEMQKLGRRKKPPFTFLSRSNPFNIYLGKLLNKPSKK